MPINKEYRKYVPGDVFGVIGSPTCPCILPTSDDKHVIVAKCEHVHKINVKSGDLALNFINESERQNDRPISMSLSSDDRLAVGLSSGLIRIYNADSGELEVNFNGHKYGSAVNTVKFDSSGLRLCSGSSDRSIIMWDIIQQTGLFRLQGHKSGVTCIAFDEKDEVLISGSKDTNIKLWDLSTQHCFATLAHHVSEVLDLTVLPSLNLLISASNEAELVVWKLKSPSVEIGEKYVEVKKCGSVLRSARDRITRIVYDEGQRVLACFGTHDTSVEMFVVCNDDEIERRIAKRMKAKRKREKRMKREVGEEKVTTTTDDESEEGPLLQDFFERLNPVKVVMKKGVRVRGLCLKLLKTKQQEMSDVCTINEISCQSRVILTVLTSNNVIQQVDVDIMKSLKSKKETNLAANKSVEHNIFRTISEQGHRSDVRSLTFSGESMAILASSKDSVKVWNRTTSPPTCITTILSSDEDDRMKNKDCEFTCCMFLPGDRHCLVSTRSGGFNIYNLASNQLLTSLEVSHEEGVASIVPYPNNKGFVSAGSKDKTVKFWSWKLENKDMNGLPTESISVEFERELRFDEEITNIAISKDCRYVCVALLDCTIKVHFFDSLKLFLSLYGHKLPVTCVTISCDASLIVSGSGDKNLKVWGSDFGDCHKSIFAHDDVITDVQFLPGTHMAFSCSRDGTLKQWDMDSFQRIITLHGHLGPIWSLSLSKSDGGKRVVTCSQDGSMRLWQRTEEILVIDDQREMEREKTDREKDELDAANEDYGGEAANHQNMTASLPIKKSLESELGAEVLIEAIDAFKTLKEQNSLVHNENSDFMMTSLIDSTCPVLMQAYAFNKTPIQFILKIISSIKPQDLEQSLLILPFDKTLALLNILEQVLQQSKFVVSECIYKIIILIFELNFGQFYSNQTTCTLPKCQIKRIRDLMSKRLEKIRTCIGVNEAGVRFIVNSRSHVEGVEKMMQNLSLSKKSGKGKKRASNYVPILTG